MDLRRKQVILVDHNELAQAVEGLPQAEVLEIIDHHRLGSGLQTAAPVYFRNQPVGCTCTIIHQMYQENGVKIPPGNGRTDVLGDFVGYAGVPLAHLHADGS